MESIWSSDQHSLLLFLFILSTYCLQCVTPRPLDEGQSSTTTPSQAHSESCVVYLQGRIERCLDRYQQILVTYQAESTTQDQRRRLRARFCHQYQVTLQCLHESLAQCPPRPEHLNLIQLRLGYLRGFMSATCNPGRPEDLTPQPTTPTTTTTSLPTTSTTKQTTTTVFRRRKTTTRPAVRPQHRDFENNSLKVGYTINSEAPDNNAATGRWGTMTTVAPPGMKITSQSPTKFQLLFGYHGTKIAVSPSVIASNKVHMERSNVAKSDTVRIISLESAPSEDSIQEGKQVSEKLDCSVDENNRIDVRCIFSSSQRLENTWIYAVLSLIITYLTCWR